MARQHACCGLLAGVGFAAAIPSAPLPVRGLVVAVTGGAALLPDLDHPSATAARSLGVITKTIAAAVDWLSVTVYHASRTDGDPAERQGGHRTLTHTVPACVAAGLLVLAVGLLYPVALSAVCGLLAGLLALGFKRAGFGLAVSAAGVAWFVFSQYPGWSWTVSIAVAAGCLIHVAGDWVTESGVPVLWPIVSQGRRWRPVRAPVTFPAGGPVETHLVAPLLVFGLVVEVAWATGLLGVVVSAVATRGA